MYIKRHRNSWGELMYECEECNEISSTISSINHPKNCSISNPDDVNYPFDNSTIKLIQNIVREVKWRLEDVEYAKDLAPLTDIRGVHWDRRGSSSRIALGLGRTSHKGLFHMNDMRGIVMKIEPNVRWNDDNTPMSGNIDELYTWSKAIESSTDELFAEILANSADGMWLIMEECIPIYKGMAKIDGNRNALFDYRGEKYINPLIKELNRNNWVNPDYKYGNIGLNDDGKTVVLDYGTGPDYSE